MKAQSIIIKYLSIYIVFSFFFLFTQILYSQGKNIVIKGDNAAPVEKKMPVQDIIEKKVKRDLKIGIGLDMGYSMPSNTFHDNSFTFGGKLSFIFGRYFGIEINGLFHKLSVLEDQNAFSNGELTNAIFDLSLQGRLPIGQKMGAFLFAGINYNLNNFTINNDLLNSWKELGIDITETIDNNMGFHLGAGLDFFITKKLAVGMNIKYVISKPNGSWVFVDQLSNIEINDSFEKLNLNSLYLGITLKYFILTKSTIFYRIKRRQK